VNLKAPQDIEANRGQLHIKQSRHN